MFRKLLAGLAVPAIALMLVGCDVDVEDPGTLPDVDVTPGEPPDIDVQTPDVDVTPKKTEIEVPDIDVKTEKKEITVPDVDVNIPDENDQ